MTDVCKILLDNYDERMRIMNDARLVGDDGQSVYQARLRIAQCGKSAIEQLQQELIDKPTSQDSIKKTRKLRKYVNLMRRLCSKKNSCRKKFKSKKRKIPNEIVKNIQKICANTGVGLRKGFCGDIVTLEDAVNSTKITLKELQGILSPRKGISSGQPYEADLFKYLRPLSVEQKVSNTNLRKLKIYTLDDIAKELINLEECFADGVATENNREVRFVDQDYLETPELEFTVLDITNKNKYKSIYQPYENLKRTFGLPVAVTCDKYFEKKKKALKSLDKNTTDQNFKETYQDMLTKEGINIYKVSDLDLEFEKGMLEQKIKQLQSKIDSNNVRSTTQYIGNLVVNKFKRGSRMERKEDQRKIKLQTELAILEQKLKLLTESL